MKIAKTNINYGDYYFDAGSEIIAPDNIIHEISSLWYEVPDKEGTAVKEKVSVKENVIEEKLMTTKNLKDKKLKSYKNK